MNLDAIISTLRKVYDKYSGIRLGIAGSFANGTQKPDSDIDIVIDGDSMRVDIMELTFDAKILKYFRNQIDHVYKKQLAQTTILCYNMARNRLLSIFEQL